MPDELTGSCDLLLQLLSAGCTFAEALLSQTKEQLLEALDRRVQRLKELHITHNNLKAESLRRTDDFHKGRAEV